jgi:hypothetical protein
MVFLQVLIGLLSSSVLLEFLQHLSSALGILNTIYKGVTGLPSVLVS